MKYHKIVFQILLLITFLFLLAAPSSGLAKSDELGGGKSEIRPPEVAYQLAWPGILPDHPLYKLKVARDKLILRLVRNPVKKLEYYLLFADKGIYAAKLLLSKGKSALAYETALKAEHNYTLLVSEYKQLVWKDQPIPGALDSQIKLAGQKHQEVLGEMIGVAETKDQEVLVQVWEFSRRNYQELTNLKSTSVGQ